MGAFSRVDDCRAGKATLRPRPEGVKIAPTTTDRTALGTVVVLLHPVTDSDFNRASLILVGSVVRVKR